MGTGSSFAEGKNERSPISAPMYAFLTWTVESLESSHSPHFIENCEIAAYEARSLIVFALLNDTA
jgi:hypothetical protein